MYIHYPTFQVTTIALIDRVVRKSTVLHHNLVMNFFCLTKRTTFKSLIEEGGEICVYIVH